MPNYHAGYRVARVRAIFSIPKHRIPILFPAQRPPEYLAYIEWYTPFTAAPGDVHDLYKITQVTSTAERDTVPRSCTIIPLTDVRRSIHLYPCFGRKVPRDWTSDNVLDCCPKFLVSCFTDRHTYGTVV